MGFLPPSESIPTAPDKSARYDNVSDARQHPDTGYLVLLSLIQLTYLYIPQHRQKQQFAVTP